MALPFATLFNEAFVGWMLWNWFVAPLSLAGFFGLMFLFAVVLWALTKDNTMSLLSIKQQLVDKFITIQEKDNIEYYTHIGYFFIPFIYLGLGYIAYLCL